jgi:hypothetical protein
MRIGARRSRSIIKTFLIFGICLRRVEERNRSKAVSITDRVARSLQHHRDAPSPGADAIHPS